MDLQYGIPVEEEKKEEIVRSLNECILCGTTLIFKHIKNHKENTVQEAGCCPSCGIQTKVNSFILQ